MDFNFLQGARQQPIQLAGGYNRNSLDFSRPLSSFSGGYNQQMGSLDSATDEPTNGYMQFNPQPNPAMDNARQIAPSLLAQSPQKGLMGSGLDSINAQGAQAKAEMMAAQGSPMLSQVPQIGGRYQRRFQGLLG